jgi:metal-responsive CopG/Arc/MetJ family transcriptional regulator
MRTRVSVTLPQELLGAVDRCAKQEKKTRSNLIEVAVRAFIEQQTRTEQDARDLEIINRHADSLNKEAAEVLEYQVLP